jgi:DMSO/TMAO reductase YedYZ molybdopterin-dependent catalytic subunit
VKGGALPPGQHERADLPRFGLTPFAKRFPYQTDRVEIVIRGNVRREIVVAAEFATLHRLEQRSDFHCVTTWSCRGLNWSGVRFSDFFSDLVKPLAVPHEDVATVVLRGQDGYHASLPLADLLVPEVLLADRLNGGPLAIEHGAPLRLVAPAHYGYKCVKHIRTIEFWTHEHRYRPVGFAFMAHPRARVALEERGRWPARLLRWMYRPLIGPTVRRFARATRPAEK